MLSTTLFTQTGLRFLWISVIAFLLDQWSKHAVVDAMSLSKIRDPSLLISGISDFSEVRLPTGRKIKVSSALDHRLSTSQFDTFES